MKRVMMLSLVGVLLAGMLACGPRSSGGETASGGVDIRITNRSLDDICYVLISPSSDEAWGPDRLDDDMVISPGESHVFTMDSDTYDVQAETCQEEVMAFAQGIRRNTTLTVGGAGVDARLVVVNLSSLDLCTLLIAPSSADEWGENALTEPERIAPEAARIFYVDADLYDLAAHDCEGNVLVEEFEVDLTEDLVWNIGE